MFDLSRLVTIGVICLSSVVLAFPASADEPKDWKRFRFELEGGPVWQTKNDVRIPGNTGTEFAFKDLTGSGPYAAGRFTFDWNFLERHGLRLEIAPLLTGGALEAVTGCWRAALIPMMSKISAGSIMDF